MCTSYTTNINFELQADESPTINCEGPFRYPYIIQQEEVFKNERGRIKLSSNKKATKKQSNKTHL